MTLFELTVALAISSGTAILLVGLGEMLAEKVGVLNIGLEGIMLMGAVGGFIAGVHTGNPVLGLLAAAAVGGVFNLIFGTAAVALKADQIICGLALVFMGIGLSGEWGKTYVGRAADGRLSTWNVPGLSEIPVLGPILFRQVWLVYVALCLPFLAHFLLYHTRHGLNMRAIGDDPTAADAAGIPVVPWQMFYVFVCGALGGLGGGYLSLGVIQHWGHLLTGGLGWIALAIVFVAGWRPVGLIFAAFLFGGLRALNDVAQQFGWPIPSEFLTMLPYLGTFIVVVGRGLWYWRRPGRRVAPEALGIPFIRN
jgi:general nucleoside transport system permease protein